MTTSKAGHIDQITPGDSEHAVPSADPTVASFRVSVIIAHTRPTVMRCLDGLARQTLGHDAFEVLVIGANPEQVVPSRYDFSIRYIECAEINPSTRRHRGLAAARGELFAFVDDDAKPAEDWLEVAVELFEMRPQLVIAGGVTLFPDWADFGELLTHKLAHAGFFGNGHENLAEDSASPDRVLGYITSCNMIYAPRRAHLPDSFAVHVGYGGEDTLLIYEVARRQPEGVYYSTRLRVHHSRGSFGVGFLKTRFKYRLNNGLMLWVLPKIYAHNPKFAAGFLSASLICLAGIGRPSIFVEAFLIHQLLSFFYAARYFSVSKRLFLTFPIALALIHAVYFFGVCAGFVSIALPAQTERVRQLRRRLFCA